VKYLLFLTIPFFYLTNCFAQDTIEKRNRLTDSVIERFYVLKSNPDVRQGPYKAFFKRRTLIAAGNYNNGQKTGIWYFYNQAGAMIEKYNYNTHTFLLEAPLDKNADLGFLFDESMKKTDTLTRPLKAGGSYYGFIPYLNIFQAPFNTMDINTNSFDAYVELLISPLGRLADYKVHLSSAFYDYDQTINLDVSLFSEADRTFLPATLNGKPILSRIIIRCFFDYSGGLDFY
jgi:hypothetical protein